MTTPPLNGNGDRRHGDGPAITRPWSHADAVAGNGSGGGGNGSRIRVCIVIGTRPEAIKLAPVVAELAARPTRFEPFVVSTAQHKEMLDQAMASFGINADIDLGLMRSDQTPSEFTSRALAALSNSFEKLQPDIVVTQGDTSTTLSGALAATYLQIPVAHVEAGLRSGDVRNPFPEEFNRRVVGVLASLHFCPTEQARRNLIAEGIDPESIVVTGNTIVDALLHTPRAARFHDRRLAEISWEDHRVALVTMHRRENLGEPIVHVCRALRELTDTYPDLQVLFPVHMNPKVRATVLGELDGDPRIRLLDPLDYSDLLEVMRRSTVILTDSGGIQEECPSLRKPVLILRERTERPEVVTSGFGRLVGTGAAAVVREVSWLLDDPDEAARRVSGTNPFGDGRAAARIADVLAERIRPTRLPAAGDAWRSVASRGSRVLTFELETE